MHALSLLHKRNSVSKLAHPAPQGESLQNLLKAALRAPDHARLRPTRFLVIEGEAQVQLGELFAEAAEAKARAAGEEPLTVEARNKLVAKAQRAPMIIVVIASIKPHPKVPAIEQILTAGCAAHAILLAAQAQGFAGIWRTGGNAYSDHVKSGLGLAPAEELVGYLYLGSSEGVAKTLREEDVSSYYQHWQRS